MMINFFKYFLIIWVSLCVLSSTIKLITSLIWLKKGKFFYVEEGSVKPLKSYILRNIFDIIFFSFCLFGILTVVGVIKL